MMATMSHGDFLDWIAYFEKNRKATKDRVGGSGGKDRQVTDWREIKALLLAEAKARKRS